MVPFFQLFYRFENFPQKKLGEKNYRISNTDYVCFSINLFAICLLCVGQHLLIDKW